MKFPLRTKKMKNGCIALLPPRRKGTEKFETKKRWVVKYKEEDWFAARLSYHLNVEPIPRRLRSRKRGLICHHCDVIWCINPKHLYLGTAKQNTADIFKRNKFIRKRMSAAGKGRPKSPEHRAKIGAAHKGKIHPQWQRERNRQGQLGKKLSEEHKEKLRIASIRMYQENPQLRILVGLKNKGKKLSQETKNRMGVAQRKVWAEKRGEI